MFFNFLFYLQTLSKAEIIGWEWISKRDSVRTVEYGEAMKLPNRTAKNHIQKMKKLGLLKMTGAGRATRYEVIRR
jgi:Fic family protein